MEGLDPIELNHVMAEAGAGALDGVTAEQFSEALKAALTAGLRATPEGDRQVIRVVNAGLMGPHVEMFTARLPNGDPIVLFRPRSG